MPRGALTVWAVWVTMTMQIADDAAALIEGDIELTGDMAGRLETTLGMNTRFWLGLERGYREDLAKVAAENAQEETKMFKHSKTYMAIPPGATIKEMIDDRGISEAQLATRLGESEEFVRQLIEGETQLTAEVAGKLAAGLGMNMRFWLNMESYYREDLVNIDRENAQEEARNARKLARKAKRANKKTTLVVQAGLTTSS